MRVTVANGRGKCLECGEGILKGEKQIAERDTWGGEKRRCKKCFLKIFAILFSEELKGDNEEFYKVLKALIMLNKIEEVNAK